MSRFYRRTDPSSRDNLTAGFVALGLAAAVGAISFYLTRLFMARESLDPLPPRPQGTAPPGEGELD